jgi:putative transposase
MFNTDQGCQFTSIEFTDILKEHNLKINRDGLVRTLDNSFAEKL